MEGVLHRRSTFSQALHQAPQGYESIKEYLYIHLVQEALNIRGSYLISLPYTNSSLSVSDRGDRRVATGRALGKNINITPPCSVSPGTQLPCSVGGDCPPAAPLHLVVALDSCCSRDVRSRRGATGVKRLKGGARLVAGEIPVRITLCNIMHGVLNKIYL